MNIDKLADEWRSAKQREDQARLERIEIEQKIIEISPPKEEGAVTVHTPLGNNITLVGKVTYKCDLAALVALTSSWPEDIRPIKTKVEADETKLKALRADVPKLWAQISPAIETKPAKTGVSIKFAT
jgi:hypothetical protein